MLRVDVQHRAGGEQHFLLLLAIADVAPGLVHHAAGQQAIFHGEHVGARVVDAEQVADAIGEESETAGDEQRLEACVLCGLHERLCTGVELQALIEHLVQGGDRHALEQGDALPQAFLVVGDLAAHRGLGDGGHFRLAAGCGCDLIDALDVDQGRVHVEGDELEVGEAKRRGEAADDEAVGGR